VVDDSALVGEAITLFLSHSGLVAQSVTSTEKAQRVLADEAFDLVIIDPVLKPSSSGKAQSGIDFILELRRANPRIPVIVLSSSREYPRALLALGIPLIDKRYSVGELIQLVQDVMSRQAEAQSMPLEDIRRVFSEELTKLLALKEQTLTLPGEGTYELPKALQGFKKDLERQLLQFPFEQNVFLMMKFRSTNRDVADYITEILQRRDFRAVRADDREWNITGNVYNPIAVLYCCKYGIALFDEPEDRQAYSPNVAYELGIMHQQNEECLILRHSSLPQVPFDLIKDLYESYDRDLQLRRIIERWSDEIAARRK
jgi:DNA-binding response OmpR family regulator